VAAYFKTAVPDGFAELAEDVLAVTVAGCGAER